jgi:hypothetical protein
MLEGPVLLRKSCENRLKTLLAFAPAMLVVQLAFSQVLYNIDFNEQTPNQLVQTGSPPRFVSSINFGSPKVVPMFGPLQHQPLVLDMVGNAAPFYYDQIQLNLPRLSSSTLDTSFDFASSGLVGSQTELAILFDNPQVQNVYFQDDGGIYRTDHFLNPTKVGSFLDGVAYHISIHIDFQQQQWSISENGTLLGTDSYGYSASSLQDIRFSYGLVSSISAPDLSAVGLDNVLVAVPEPSSLALLALSSLCGIGYRALQRASREGKCG